LAHARIQRFDFCFGSFGALICRFIAQPHVENPLRELRAARIGLRLRGCRQRAQLFDGGLARARILLGLIYHALSGLECLLQRVELSLHCASALFERGKVAQMLGDIARAFGDARLCGKQLIRGVLQLGRGGVQLLARGCKLLGESRDLLFHFCRALRVCFGFGARDLRVVQLRGELCDGNRNARAKIASQQFLFRVEFRDARAKF
jgi:hypothetical protein